jgi:hypothetical protein
VAEQQKSKSGKRPRTAKSAAQYFKTAKNKQKARDRHASMNPDDKQARENWKAHPIRTSKNSPK